MQSLLDYVYISKSKVEALADQLPSNPEWTLKSKTGLSLPAILGIPALSTEVEAERKKVIKDTLHSKLGDVVAALHATNQLGPLGSKKPYRYGRVEMAWVGFGFKDYDAFMPAKECPIALWVNSQPGSIFVLAGSARHIIGDRRTGESGAHSYTPFILRWLQEQTDEQFKNRNLVYEGDPPGFETPRKYGIGVLATARQLAKDQPTEQYDFVCRVLLQDQQHLLATPLAVIRV